MENRLILGTHPSIKELIHKIEKISQFNINVLIRGETGVGKELVAREIHYQRDTKRPFVAINCSGLSSTFLESELFGHVKGAFTSAFQSKSGLVEKAKDGTILFDEIGDIEYESQLKLLRFLETREYRKLGSTQIQYSNARFVFATNANLEDLIKKNRFRQDLYFRIKEVELEVPPLRERKEDIPLLCDHFLDIFSKQFNINRKHIVHSALQYLVSYNWPGNIRELSNVIKYCLILSQGKYIGVNDLPQHIKEFKNTQKSIPIDSRINRILNNSSFKRALEELEKHYLLKFANQCYTKEQLGKLMEWSYPTLLAKIQRYRLENQIQRIFTERRRLLIKQQNEIIDGKEKSKY